MKSSLSAALLQIWTVIQPNFFTHLYYQNQPQLERR